MTLRAPDLDKRRFDELVAEARARIPRYTPEWTNFNDSDPGMTLVKLHAWMTETILYELNKVPELNYIKFLDLIGIKPRPAQPARCDLKFTLEKLPEPNDDLVVPVPKGTKVSVDDPDLPREVVFETDRSLLALNAEIGAVLAHPTPKAPSDKDPTDSSDTMYQLVTLFEDGLDWSHSFHPFDPAAKKHSTLYLGLLLRPNAKPPLNRFANDALPAGPLSLYVDTLQILDREPPPREDVEPEVVTGPLSSTCINGSSRPTSAAIEWQIFSGEQEQPDFIDTTKSNGWTTLALSADSTAGLTRSGQIVLELPAGATLCDPMKMHSTFWSSFDMPKPPQSKQDLVDMLGTASPEIVEKLAKKWEDMGVASGDVKDFEGCANDPSETRKKVIAYPSDINPGVLAIEEWVGIDDAYDVSLPKAKDKPKNQEVLRHLYWLRARISRDLVDREKPAAIRSMHLNTIGATQGATRLEEQLGRSNGRPAQRFTLPKTPVLIDPHTGLPDLILSVSATGEPTPWQQVEDFFKSGPDSPHYLLDPETGVISFGDGRRGRIPVANDRVTAIRYRVGGGTIGNVAEGVISKIKGRVRNVKSAANIRPSHDGSDAETLEGVKLRAPHDIRSRDRAVSARDFADLAMETPGVNLHSASPLARTAVSVDENGTRTFKKVDGAVSLVIVPRSDEQAPQPSEEQLEAICRWLAPRRLITTELHVTGPTYAQVSELKMKLSIHEDYDISSVTESVYVALLRFLHPIVGGHDQRGWPLGEDIFYGDLYDLVLGIAGVRRASELSVEINGKLGNSTTDVAVLTDAKEPSTPRLPELTRDAIKVVASYA